MRYYLDTNILVFLVTGNTDELTTGVRGILEDYGNVLLTSSECVHELMHLCQIDRLEASRSKQSLYQASDVLEWLRELDIKIVYVAEKHLECYSNLSIPGDHHDPTDRLIIAQAISDRIPLISSDRKFERYVKLGLEFIFNER